MSDKRYIYKINENESIKFLEKDAVIVSTFQCGKHTFHTYEIRNMASRVCASGKDMPNEYMVFTLKKGIEFNAIKQDDNIN